MDKTTPATPAPDEGRFRFTFSCGLCGASYTTPLLEAGAGQEAFDRARADARRHFNRCRQCGQWVCDAHYDETAMLCTACFDEAACGVCPTCGSVLPAGASYCTSCGAWVKAGRRQSTL